MLVTMTARLVRSHGKDEIPLPGSGRIEYRPAIHGTYQGALRGTDTVYAKITEGVAEPVELTPGPWRVMVRPDHGTAWESWLIELTEGMDEPVDLVDLAPVLVVDGEKWAAGPAGPSAYDAAVAGGFEGTEAEWLASLHGEDGHTPAFTWEGTALAIDGGELVDLQGEQGFQGASIVDVEQTSPDSMRVTMDDPATGEEQSRTITLPRGPEGPYGGTEVTDPQVASWVDDPGTVTRTAVDAAIVAGAASVAEAAVAPVAARGALPGIFSLIAGTEDEVFLLSAGASATPDTTNYRVGGQGWKIASTSAGTLSASVNGPIAVPPFQAVGLWVYVPDPSVITDMGVYLYFSQDLAAANRFWRAFKAHSPQTPIVQGWNFFRIPADLSIPGMLNRGTIWRASVYAVTTSASASFTIGHLYLETPPKARVVMIADRGYQDFYSGLYQDLKARKIPVTFAVDVTLFGTGAGRILAMSEELMHEVARENGNSISFHGWDGTPTSTMTAAQLRADTAKAVKWLQTHGYSGRMWRAAYVQGSAPAWQSARGLLVGSASGTGPSRPNPWPPQDMHNIYRYALDNTSTPAQVDVWFDWLKATHMTDLVFVHSESLESVDYSPELRAHFLARVDQAITEGWLEFHTFESLFHQSGGTFQSLGGAHVAEFTDAAGARVTQSVL